jgi:hypothetical protein
MEELGGADRGQNRLPDGQNIQAAPQSCRSRPPGRSRLRTPGEALSSAGQEEQCVTLTLKVAFGMIMCDEVGQSVPE